MQRGSDRLPPEYWQTRADKVRPIADDMLTRDHARLCSGLQMSTIASPSEPRGGRGRMCLAPNDVRDLVPAPGAIVCAKGQVKIVCNVD
jgi:hypothetical protein